LVVVVLDVVVAVVLVVIAAAAGSGAQSIFDVRGWSARVPNWSVHSTFDSAARGHFTL